MKRLFLLTCWVAIAVDFDDRYRHGAVPESIAGWRAMAAMVHGEDVGVLCVNAQDLEPMDRSRLITANWELGARPAEAIGIDRLAGAPACLLTTTSLKRPVRSALLSASYRPVVSNAFATVWRRGGG